MQSKPIGRSISAEARFWTKVNKTGGCWIWTAGRINSTYGHFTMDSTSFLAHRVSFTWEHGPIPDGVEIDHKCHNKACVRPSHLRHATTKQNQENRTGPASNSKSGVRGVFWHSGRQRWEARVKHNGKYIHVGRFKVLADAAEAVRITRLQIFTHSDVDRIPA